MKKQFSPRRNKRSVAQLSVFVTVLVIVMVFVAIRFLLPDVYVALAAPLWKSGSSLDAGVGNAFSGLTHGSTLAADDQTLSNEVTQLENENAVLTARDQDLTKSEGGQSTSVATILAGVLASPPLSPYDTLVVAAGSQDGIIKGAEVFAEGGIPVGTVGSVTAHSAIVELISTTGVVTNGWIGNDRLALTLTGTGAGTFSASLPKAAPVSTGDTVYVPGPGAVPVGTVTQIDTDPSSPNVTIHIQPLVNPFSLTWVTVAAT